jgi:hypothetical protein
LLVHVLLTEQQDFSDRLLEVRGFVSISAVLVTPFGTLDISNDRVPFQIFQGNTSVTPNPWSLAIILLGTLALTLMVPVVSGVSLLQHVKAETSGQNGMNGINQCGSQPYHHHQLAASLGVVLIRILLI